MNITARFTHSPYDYGGDSSSREGAQKLAQKLKDYWAAEGYAIEARIESKALQLLAKRESQSVYCLRSNLIRGFPVGYTGKRKPLYAF